MGYSDNEIRELLVRASNYDREAMSLILNGYAKDLFFIARLYQRDRRTTKGVEENAFRHIFQFADEGTRQQDCNKWMTDQLRNLSIRTLLPVAENEQAFDTYNNADETINTRAYVPEKTVDCQDKILEVLDLLNKEERVCFALRFYDHMSLVDVASELMIQINSVKRYLASAKEKVSEAGYDLGSFIAWVEKLNPDLNKTNYVAIQAIELEPEPEPVIENSVDFIGEGDTLNMGVKDSEKEIDVDSMLVPPRDEENFVYDDYDYDDYEEPNKKNIAIIIIVVCLLIMALACFGYYLLFMR